MKADSSYKEVYEAFKDLPNYFPCFVFTSNC